MVNKIKARQHRLGEEFSTRALSKWTDEDLAAKLVETLGRPSNRETKHWEDEYALSSSR
jgi:hypothetical protein